MKAYIIIDVTIRDAARMEAYKKLVPATLVPFNGKFIVRGGTSEVLEGDWNPNRIVIIEFPSMGKAKAWWSSDDYAPAKSIRQSAAVTKMIMIEGMS